MIRKDEVLDRLARRGNVAQFIGFEPARRGPKPTFSRICGQEINKVWTDTSSAISALLAASAERSVNVRSYSPEDPQSREFVYGLTDAGQIIATIERLSAEGLHTIANETVDVKDGGVSGVLQGSMIEFSPDDTPRCVERAGTAALDAAAGLDLLEVVYGVRPELTPVSGVRVEFSIHPRPRGWRATHTLLWEHEAAVNEPLRPLPQWPNNFSRLIGDKAYGLLIADGSGLPVPRTLVIGRRVAPFSFGRSTGSHEIWTRTCPCEPQPGLYTTVKGWADPFDLLAREDASGDAIASLLRQDAVKASHSGAAMVGRDGELIVEGVVGEGDGFMLGTDLPQQLPSRTLDRVHEAFDRLHSVLGPVRFEWVDDGERLWIVQLHVGATSASDRVVVGGEAEQWIDFDSRQGLAELRTTLRDLPVGAGVVVRGGAGVTSHIADVLRKAGFPARLAG